MKARTLMLIYVVVVLLATFVLFVPLVPANAERATWCYYGYCLAYHLPAHVSVSFYLFGFGAVDVNVSCQGLVGSGTIPPCGSTYSWYWSRSGPPPDASPVVGSS